jgi:hypothetical protein
MDETLEGPEHDSNRKMVKGWSQLASFGVPWQRSWLSMFLLSQIIPRSDITTIVRSLSTERNKLAGPFYPQEGWLGAALDYFQPELLDLDVWMTEISNIADGLEIEGRSKEAETLLKAASSALEHYKPRPTNDPESTALYDEMLSGWQTMFELGLAAVQLHYAPPDAAEFFSEGAAERRALFASQMASVAESFAQSDSPAIPAESGQIFDLLPKLEIKSQRAGDVDAQAVRAVDALLKHAQQLSEQELTYVHAATIDLFQQITGGFAPIQVLSLRAFVLHLVGSKRYDQARHCLAIYDRARVDLRPCEPPNLGYYRELEYQLLSALVDESVGNTARAEAGFRAAIAVAQDCYPERWSSYNLVRSLIAYAQFLERKDRRNEATAARDQIRLIGDAKEQLGLLAWQARCYEQTAEEQSFRAEAEAIDGSRH